jgi:phenylacetic acid degradation operon negative regulatory protein
MYRFGPIQQKILLALLGGVALGSSSSPRQYFRTFRQLKKEWGKINQRNFNRSIHKLSRNKLVEERKLPDGSFKLVLTEDGRKQVKRLNFLDSSIKFMKPKKWDGQWRIVIFDIPEKDRVFRDILRDHLYALKFYKLQQSVFISPYPFEKYILDLVALYSAELYVRVITATKIDNESQLKKHFSGFI